MVQRLMPFLKWTALLVVLAEVLLVWTGTVPLADAVVVVVVVEGLLLAVVLLGALRVRHVYREQRADAPDGFTAATRAIEAVLPRPMGKLIAAELALQRALLLLALRRRDVPPGGAGVGYHRALSGILWAVLAVTLVEIAVVHLAVPWPTVRVVLLVLSVVGLWWFTAFFASLVAYPTTVHDGRLRIRFSATVDVAVPLTGVESVRVDHRSRAQRRVAMFHDDALHVEVFGSSNVTVRFTRPVPVSLPREDERLVSTVHLWADEPEALLRLLSPDALRPDLP
ncbi:hypothetical protein GL263_12150 [Streptomyces durbertensis]|uniref:Integral membrane protein n=1 Tax=Streptomyces durbertensis TaxID=2448886 RepID=A0ABR6EH50_9ACTN|nr:hypothetical protein [Streptomyces durbertensis]MBB1244305.1 hypothetical protein [Streptomyces durbertensis]